ncbi:MAG: T9SS type A sorting domain-containing protein [Ignavibacteria bacterium]|nr:T9SS type A sorting domain-containing protein [Ignavibacteria bacterium]
MGLNPLTSSIIYTDMYPGKLYISYDKGRNWVYRGVTGMNDIRQIVVHPNDTLTIFCAGNFPSDGLRKSIDGGVTWQVVIGSYAIDGESITYDPQHPDTMYAGSFVDGKVYRSFDRGETWRLMGIAGTELCAFAVRPDSVNVLYAGTGNGTISKSTNYGSTWRVVRTNPSRGFQEVPKFVVNQINPMVAYASLYGDQDSSLGIVKTTDGGEHWAITSLRNIEMWGIEMDPSNPEMIYAGTFSDSIATVFQTTDGGATWISFGNGIPEGGQVWSFHIHPLAPTDLWLACVARNQGATGVYTWLSSSTIISGIVADSSTGDTIRNGRIANFSTTDVADLSQSSGTFEFGYFEGDSTLNPTLHVSAYPYYLKDLKVTFIPDSVLHQDILLKKLDITTISGIVRDSLNHKPLQAKATLFSTTSVGDFSRTVATDSQGRFALDSVYISYSPINQYTKLLVEPEIPYVTSTIVPSPVDHMGLSLQFDLNIADVLVASSTGSGNYGSYYQSALDSLGLRSYLWDVTRQGVPPLRRGTEFREKTIIYFSGINSTPLLSSEADSLIACLDSGCDLFLTGQNFLELNDSTPLFSNYLKIGYGGNSSIVYTKGINNDLFNGFGFYTTGDGANDQTSRDILVPNSGSVKPIMSYGVTGSLGTAAIRIDTLGAGSKAIVMGYGFEAINGALTRKNVLKQILGYFDGTIVVNVGDLESALRLPTRFSLDQNYPNPFNPSTIIRYALPVQSHVALRIYNVLGQHVATLVDEIQDAGYKQVEWDASKMASGVYFYKLTTGTFVDMKKMILIR